MNNNRFRIGIIDDEQDYLDEIKIKIEEGIENTIVITTSNPNIAKDWVKQNQVDLIISDNLMDDIKGVDLLVQLREINDSIPLATLSAFNFTAIEKEILLKIKVDAKLNKDDQDYTIINNIKLLIYNLLKRINDYEDKMKEILSIAYEVYKENEKLKDDLIEIKYEKNLKGNALFLSLFFASSFLISIVFNYSIISRFWSELGFFISISVYLMALFMKRRLIKKHRA